MDGDPATAGERARVNTCGTLAGSTLPVVAGSVPRDSFFQSAETIGVSRLGQINFVIFMMHLTMPGPALEII